jgi:hypothetical protein
MVATEPIRIDIAMLSTKPIGYFARPYALVLVHYFSHFSKC